MAMIETVLRQSTFQAGGEFWATVSSLNQRMTLIASETSWHRINAMIAFITYILSCLPATSFRNQAEKNSRIFGKIRYSLAAIALEVRAKKRYGGTTPLNSKGSELVPPSHAFLIMESARRRIK
jgi:hypothetical protein